MKTAILGGSFDPPHNGHLITSLRLLDLKLADKIILMPLFKHPFSKKLSPSAKRFKMTSYLENDRIKISDLEIRKENTSYTIDTLMALSKKHPAEDFRWIIGADQIKNITRWKDWKKIADKFKIIVVSRARTRKVEKEIENIKKSIASPENIILIDKEKIPPIDISSTLIRKRIREGKSISKLVPKAVERYIIKHNLYL